MNRLKSIYNDIAGLVSSGVFTRFVRFLKLRSLLHTSFTKSSEWFTRFQQVNTRQKLKMLLPAVFLVSLYVLVRFSAPFFVPPKLVSVFPENLAVEIPLDSKIELVFDKPMYKESVERNISFDPAILGTFEWESEFKLIFTPSEKLTRGKKYTITLKEKPFSKFMIPLKKGTLSVFETVGNPKVIVASPATESLLDLSPIVVMFDRPMIPLTTVEGKSSIEAPFKIEPAITGEGRWLGTSAFQFRPDKPYKKGVVYKVTVAKNIQSVDGGVMEDDYVWEFVGGIPRVESVTPSAGYLYASPVGSVRIKFSQEINLDSAKQKISLTELSANTKIQGLFSKDPKDKLVIAFTPSGALKRGLVYYLSVDKGVLGVEGPVGSEMPFASSFTVSHLPQVIGSVPSNGAQNVQDTNSASVSFNVPMDEDSLRKNIVISPTPKEKPNVYFSTYSNSVLIDTFFERSKDYSITVKADAKDQYGVPLGKDFTFSFKTGDYKPSISIVPGQTFFAVFNKDIIPRIVAQVTNADKVYYNLYKLNENEFRHLFRLNQDYNYAQQFCSNYVDCMNWQTYDPSKLEKIRSWEESFDLNKSVPVNVVTKVTTQNGSALKPGAYFLTTGISSGAQDKMVMVVTGVSVTLKYSPNQVFAWVVNQSTGEPVGGMDLSVSTFDGKNIAYGTTGADGIWVKDTPVYDEAVSQYPKLLVTGRKGDDFILTSSTWDSGIKMYEFGLTGYNFNYSGEENYKLYVHLDNPIYRPGQEVFFRGVIKKDTDGKFEAIKTGDFVDISVEDIFGNQILTQRVTVNSYGSFDGKFSLSEGAGLGRYNLTASYQKSYYTQPFDVEEYRVSEFQVKVEPQKEYFFNKETAPVTINASYYFGAPVSNSSIKWTLKRSSHFFSWEKDRTYEFSNESGMYSWYGSADTDGELVSEGSGVTDSRGSLELKLPIDISKQPGSQLMVLEATVQDVSNQVISGAKEFLVHKGEFYLGLKSRSYVVSPNSDAFVDLVTVGLNGKEVGDKDMSVQFSKISWETIKEKSEDDGNYYWNSKQVEKVIETQKTTTDSNGRASVSFKPESGGVFKLTASSTDSRGNKITSSTYLWVYGEGFEAQRQNHDRIPLIMDKTAYYSGEEISVLAATPFPTKHKSLVTIERGKVMDFFLADAGGDSDKIKIKLKDSYSPNIFVSVVVPKGGNSLKSPPEFKIGYAKVDVTDKKNKLSVDIRSDRKEYKPGEKVKVRISTTDQTGAGRKANVLLGVSDKAVWDLSFVTFPDIYTQFFQPKNNKINTSNSLTISMDRVNANTNLGAKGGSGGGGGNSGLFDTSRFDFQKTAYWNPNIETNDKGDAEVEFTLPDNLTTWEVFALANTKESGLGYSKAELLVTKDLVIKPFIPRFVSVGDEVDLGAIVVNKTSGDSKASLELRSENLQLSGSKNKTMSVPKGGQAKSTWKVLVLPGEFVKLGLQLKSSDGKLQDSVEVAVPIKEHYTPEVTATSGQVKNVSEEDVILPKSVIPNKGSLDLLLSPQLGASELTSVAYLKTYEYACDEQVSSKIIGALGVKQVLDKVGLDHLGSVYKSDLDKVIIDGIQQLVRDQKADGGFGWWGDFNSNSDPFVSAYAYRALYLASRTGYVVPTVSLQNAEKYLISHLSGVRVNGPYTQIASLNDEQKAFILFVLPDKNRFSSYASNLWSTRFKLSTEGKAYLAMSLKDISGMSANGERLKNEVLSLVKKTSTASFWESGYNYYLMGDTSSTTATVIQMLTMYDRNNPLIVEAVRYLASVKKGDGSFGSTRSTASVLSGISAYIMSQNNQALDETYEVKLSSREIIKGSFKKDDLLKVVSQSVPVSSLIKDASNKVSISRSGVGNLYYNLNLKYFNSDTEVKELEQGLTVVRELLRPNGSKITNGVVSEGDELLVRITLAVPELRRHVIIEDMLPAGFEAVNESLKNQGVMNAEKPISQSADPYASYYFERTEYRDDKVATFASYLPHGVYELIYRVRATTPGKYHYAPAVASQMYFPDVFGRSAGGWLTVMEDK